MQVHSGCDGVGGNHNSAAGEHAGAGQDLDDGSARAHDPLVLGQGVPPLWDPHRSSVHHGSRLRSAL